MEQCVRIHVETRDTACVDMCLAGGWGVYCITTGLVPIQHHRLSPKLAYRLSNIRKKPLYNKACGAAPDCCGGKYAPVLNIIETNSSPLLEY